MRPVRDSFPVFTARRGLISFDPNDPANIAARQRREEEHRRADVRWGVPYRRLLDAVTDPTLKAMVEHHSPRVEAHDEDNPPCEGCDIGGNYGSRADWPCSTARLIADSVGVELPRHWLDDEDDDS